MNITPDFVEGFGTAAIFCIMLHQSFGALVRWVIRREQRKSSPKKGNV